ncbi:FecR domain-containing protein [Acidovorax sp. SUPP3334]|uniref:FecR domain-containing protein n=1 Tax=Acidovorax sp. SUPP3334 TaxID=2920881 RepID=UPI0023DE47FB|nr:FecR domain-containing protein [Acidovorax sp. SUPP3334]GKT21427.1 FecR domain-containing protein [Acidovorax sp. SUPP3334]
MSGSAEPAGTGVALPLERHAVRAAAQWLARLHSGHADAHDQAACERWRAAHPEHERAWQRAQRMQAQLGLITPPLANAVLGRARDTGRRSALRALGGLVVAVPAAHLAWRQWGPAWTADHRTALGERRDITLPDGTRIWLNTDTAIDVTYSPAQRSVRLLRGEVLIETAAHAQAAAPRPFVLATREGELRPLGTRFVVRDSADGCGLTVHEGAVAVRTAQGLARTVAAGQAMRFTAGELSPSVPADPFTGRWTEGLLVARNQPLGEFLGELARYRAGIVQCDPAVAGLRIAGAFQIDRTDAVLDALPRTLPVRVAWRTRYWARVLPADAQG